MNRGGQPVAFPFRPWVRRTTLRAMGWGVGVALALGGAAWWLRGPAPAAMAFTVLVLYCVLFLATLLKIYRAALHPAVVLDADGLAYRPLYGFGMRRVAWERVLGVAPRPGSQSLGLIVLRRGRARELFLNLAVVDGRHAFLERLEAHLREAGLVPVPGTASSWRRPDFPG